MKKISKLVREEAIEALLCCAGDRPISRMVTWDWFDDHESRPAQLAAKAYESVAWLFTIHELDPATRYAEAAALLRDGWMPGDPVEVRS